MPDGIQRTHLPCAMRYVVALAAIPLFLSGCGTVQQGERQQREEKLRAPNYASPVGINRWEVNCGRDQIIIFDESLEQFYRPDGSFKNLAEFCREAEPSLIRRRQPDRPQ